MSAYDETSPRDLAWEDGYDDGLIGEPPLAWAFRPFGIEYLDGYAEGSRQRQGETLELKEIDTKGGRPTLSQSET